MYKKIVSIIITLGMLLGLMPISHAKVEAPQPIAEIPLWNQSFLNSQQTSTRPAEQISQKGSYTQISNPRMQVYVPQHSNHKAILVMSGGGYDHLEMGNEGIPVSQWLVQQGFTVFNLIYRLPPEGGNCQDSCHTF